MTFPALGEHSPNLPASPREFIGARQPDSTHCAVMGRIPLAAITAPTAAPAASPGSAGAQAGTGIHKIKHVVIIMQENRSFDSFFGTYPGADGIPARNGQFTV